jgi:hypothetical protein
VDDAVDDAVDLDRRMTLDRMRHSGPVGFALSHGEECGWLDIEAGEESSLTYGIYCTCWWYMLVVHVGGTCWWYMLVVHVGGTRCVPVPNSETLHARITALT